MKQKILILFLFTLPCALFSQTYQIKFASLAPDGSTWMNVMREFDQAIRKETNGEMGFKIYPGGVSGDEKDVMRKIKLGQLHGAGFTGVGMGEILPDVRILDSPFLFRNYNEVDYINNQFYDRFAKAFEKQGYILLGWAEVGFVYVFTNNPINDLDDLKNVKMWMWEGDAVAAATFKALGINTIPLSVINVLTALQTGMVNGVYISPLAILAVQWFTKVKYMMEFPMADAAGAVLISKSKFDNLPESYRQILLKNAQIYLTKLTRLSREDNKKAMEILKSNGIQIIPPPSPEKLKKFYEKGEIARRLLVDKLYSLSLVEETEKALEEFRKNEVVK